MRGPTPFFVYTSPPTGSAWLVSLLDSHPAIAAYAELFLADGRGRPAYGSQDLPFFSEYRWKREGWLGGGRPELVRLALFLRRLYRPRPGVAEAGFKLMYAQAERQRGLLFFLLALRRARAVHLRRANRLAALVSYEAARANGF
ncbi:MAG: hypothetical protein C4305_04410, partial [Thermoleophilia bacterium]